MVQLFLLFLCVLSIPFLSVCLAHRSVKFKVPAYSSKAFGSFALLTPFAMLRICFQFITPPPALVPIALSLIKFSPRIFGLPAWLKTDLFLDFAFQELTVVRLNVYFSYFVENLLIADAVP